MILFCDIDNVLMRHMDSRISHAANEALTIFRVAGFRFVLHSTWRAGMYAEAEQLFREAGFVLEDGTPAEYPSKRESIVTWLMDHYGDGPDWPRCVVIDDHLIEPAAGLEIIQIDPSRGLTPDVARSIVNREHVSSGA